MLTRKFISRIAWTRRGVEAFNKIVNDHFAKGWEPLAIEIDGKGLRFTCLALLSLPVQCDCDCACCTSHDETCECACDCCMSHLENNRIHDVEEECE